ncbi:M3 family metallopeptidase [Bacillus amyloliquefaciens]|nr:M3 family metallopeptidase [Bacillus amyloliquefaciens]WIX31187.1 M3 family metallopeptidase [Bacillus amyloliquefaciens]
MRHEFGHAIHAMLQDVTYPGLAGTPRDFVEFPSQFNEHWALDAKVLPHYAVNYRTGAVIPQALVDKIKRAGTLGTALAWFANVTGGWPEADRSRLADLFYGTKGLGWTIARYNIGGGGAAVRVADDTPAAVGGRALRRGVGGELIWFCASPRDEKSRIEP